jgi:hypothetical protein
MAKRYVVVNSYEDDDDYDFYYHPSSLNLHVDSSPMEFTGVLDSNGRPVFKLPRPIGFGRDSEW